MNDRPTGDELFDVVNEKDNVVGQRWRSVVHRDGLLHRAVHVWVFNAAGQLLLQMRSETKDEFPSTWTSSASGHLDAGESYQSAAVRELEEELGISADLRFIEKLPAGPETAQEFTALFITRHEGPFTPHEKEVAGLEWWDVDEAARAAAEYPDRFSPPLRTLLQQPSAREAVRLTDGPA